MIEPAPLLTDELAARVETLLAEYAGSVDGQRFARRARELGIGLVDVERSRAWIDETVYQGALWRGQLERERADLAEERVAALLLGVHELGEQLESYCGEFDT